MSFYLRNKWEINIFRDVLPQYDGNGNDNDDDDDDNIGHEHNHRPKRTKMERQLYDRDRVGVQDFVLLENYQSEEAFIDNLRKRFQENIIYTYIGQVLVSINPYQELNIYTEENIAEYKNKHFYEVPPHIFSISDNAFCSAMREQQSQCILISGESGSGKTEASKKVLEYITVCSGANKEVMAVKEKLLKSNPLLEAFGNAKTNRNDNSSRFGKYMDIQFDFEASAIGGNILNYLLEKSRVVKHNAGERNFHIFYQMLAGLDNHKLNELMLQRDISRYNYLRPDKDEKPIESIKFAEDDAKKFQMVQSAMTVIGFTQKEQNDIYRIIASILHLGNITFRHEIQEHNSKITPMVEDDVVVQRVARLLQIDAQDLQFGLTYRTIGTSKEAVMSPLSVEMSNSVRDALAKAIYDRLFTWLVERLNTSMHSSVLHNVIGILDIYGFEVFENNRFEQFCINFCNEKLQQLFIELTLRSEQEEYRREGIEWITVDFFDNKVICNLIEEKHLGIISLLDEECLMPGDTNDRTFLDKLNFHLRDHPHYMSHENAPTHIQKTMTRSEFRLMHYAGDVTYNVNGFLEKNNDQLYRDLKLIISKSKNSIAQNCFPEDELQSNKRPLTAISQFCSSLNGLMKVLMCKEPSYIRCIKPNDFQRPNFFENQLVLHQVKYLGLMENLRVRRAGFAYRRLYSTFLNRYKCLCKDTWPHYRGSDKEGVELLIQELNYQPDEYCLGHTKIFIRFPKTLFKTEDLYQKRLQYIVSKIQAFWRGWVQRKRYQFIRQRIVMLQAYCKRHLAMERFNARRNAVNKIRFFLKGYITRFDAENEYNKKFIANVKCIWLTRLSKELPKNLLDQNWPKPPIYCQEASDILHNLYRLMLARKYVKSLSTDKHEQFNLKVLAESIFKDKKATYLSSLPIPFNRNHYPEELSKQIKQYCINSIASETLRYITDCSKYDRHGYKLRQRILILTEAAIYILDVKTMKLKHRIELQHINLVVTKYIDNFVLLRISLDLVKDKGDLPLVVTNAIEFVTYLVDTTKKPDIINIICSERLEHFMMGGKSGYIDIKPLNDCEPGSVVIRHKHLIINNKC